VNATAVASNCVLLNPGSEDGVSMHAEDASYRIRKAFLSQVWLFEVLTRKRRPGTSRTEPSIRFTRNYLAAGDVVLASPAPSGYGALEPGRFRYWQLLAW